MFCDILFIAKSPFDKFFCSINILSDFLLFLYMSGVTSIVTLQKILIKEIFILFFFLDLVYNDSVIE